MALQRCVGSRGLRRRAYVDLSRLKATRTSGATDACIRRNTKRRFNVIGGLLISRYSPRIPAFAEISCLVIQNTLGGLYLDRWEAHPGDCSCSLNVLYQCVELVAGWICFGCCDGDG